MNNQKELRSDYDTRLDKKSKACEELNTMTKV